MVVGLIPLLIRVRAVPISDLEKTIYQDKTTFYDFFYKVRSEWLVIMAVLAILLLVIKLIIGHKIFRFHWFMVPAGVYAFFVLISTITATYKKAFIKNFAGIIEDPAAIAGSSNLGITGYLDRNEGMYVLLAYVALSITAYLLVSNKWQLRMLLNVALIPGMVMGLVALLQYFDMDIFKSQFGMNMMIPSTYIHIKDNIEFTLRSNYSIGLMNNPNYLGGYMSLLLMLNVAFFYYK